MQDRTKEVSMRKVVVSEFVTLDGVMEDPSWTFQFSSEEQQKFKFTGWTGETRNHAATHSKSRARAPGCIGRRVEYRGIAAP